MTNVGKLARLQRKVRQLQAKVAKATLDHAEQLERKRRKVLERRPSRMDRAQANQRKADRLARKVSNLRSGLPASTGLKRGKPLKQGKPLPARGPKYAARHEAQFSEADGYADHIRAMPCIRCHRPGPSQCMHVKGVDLGGLAADMLPGCAMCHHWQEEHKLQFEAEFLEKHGITALEMANALRAGYLLDKEQAQ